MDTLGWVYGLGAEIEESGFLARFHFGLARKFEASITALKPSIRYQGLEVSGISQFWICQESRAFDLDPKTEDGLRSVQKSRPFRVFTSLCLFTRPSTLHPTLLDRAFLLFPFHTSPTTTSHHRLTPSAEGYFRLRSAKGLSSRSEYASSAIGVVVGISTSLTLERALTLLAA